MVLLYVCISELGVLIGAAALNRENTVIKVSSKIKHIACSHGFTRYPCRDDRVY